MAVNSARVSASTTPTTVTLSGSGRRLVVKNLDGGGIISVRVDGTAAGAADENYYVAGAAGAEAVIPWPNSVNTCSVYASAACLVGLELWG